MNLAFTVNTAMYYGQIYFEFNTTLSMLFGIDRSKKWKQIHPLESVVHSGYFGLLNSVTARVNKILLIYAWRRVCLRAPSSEAPQSIQQTFYKVRNSSELEWRAPANNSCLLRVLDLFLIKIDPFHLLFRYKRAQPFS